MNQRVLFVDDEPQVLDGIQRTLRKQVDMQFASSGAEALQLMQDGASFALVVSDMRMPAMNGAQFLAKVREQQPETVRMILSGQADLESAIAVVNEGHIFRFLTKPCPAERLLAAIEDGLNQYRLRTAEKALLEETLNGAVKMLIEILGMVSPAASAYASRLQRYTTELSIALQLTQHWQWSLAAFVSQIGCVALPKDMLFKVESHQTLTDEEQGLYQSHPEVASRLLASIPRLEDVAAIVTAQLGALSFANMPDDLHHWDVRQTGQLLLRTAVDYDRLVTFGASRESAVKTLRASQVGFPPAVLRALLSLSLALKQPHLRQLRLTELRVGMTLDEDLVTPKGIRLVPAGSAVTTTLIVRLNSIASGVGVAEPFRVRVAN